MKTYIDDKGNLIGREVNGNLLDGKGKLVARFNESSNRTIDGKGHIVSRDDTRINQLTKFLEKKS